MENGLPGAGRIDRIVVAAAVVGVAMVFVLFCSGMPLPMWNARGRLNGHLSSDLGLSLPAGATVIKGTSIGSRDPAEYFLVQMPPSAAAGFVASVRGASKVEDHGAAEAWTMGKRPEWWKPEGMKDALRFDGIHADRQGGYIWYYSATSGTIYVFWFRT